MKAVYLLLLSFLLIPTTRFSQEVNDRTTGIKIERLLFLVEQMYVEEVDAKKLNQDLVLGMYNTLHPSGLYQPDSIFNTLDIEPLPYFGLGLRIKFKKGKIIVDEVLPNSSAEESGIAIKDEIICIDQDSLNQVYYYADFDQLTTSKEKSISKLTIVRKDDTLNFQIKKQDIDGYSLLPLPLFEHKGCMNNYKGAIKAFDLIYPDSITNGEITEFGIRYMLEQLDPHSTYISLEEIHDMNAPLKGSFSGVGIRFQILKDTIMVVQAIPGGPSEKVGLMAGDQIIKINDQLVAGIGMKNKGVRDRLLGDKGTKVNVSIKRRNQKNILDFEIVRDKIPIYSVDASYMVNSNTGYIKLNNFSSTTLSEIRKATFDLKDQGMENLVLDLQNNGGGYLRTAVDLSDEFLSGIKKIVSTNGRKFPERKYTTGRKGLLEDGKLIILVNESSASASEIVSGAVQDWDRGLIVGRRTFGKGLVQKPIELPDGSQVRITTSKYYTPSGRCIQKPYEEGSMAYRKEKYSRYNSGESFNADSMKFNSNESYQTLLKERTVYGGGGIIPDHFVPLDTTGTSTYFNKLIRKGIFNQFALSWVNKNREYLEKKYPNFDKFNSKFDTQNAVDELIEYAEAEGLEFKEDQYNKAKHVIHTRLKANIAQDLFNYKKFYQIINDLNNALEKSLELLKDDKAFSKLAMNNN
ncbi:MAG: S41 family peptidase [Bacteroidota bacterium]|nr:S41 family peptidase [Bacteroidota bacterium]